MNIVVGDVRAVLHGARCVIRGPNRPLRGRPGPRMTARPAGRGGAGSPGRGLAGKGPCSESRGSHVAKHPLTAPTSGSRPQPVATGNEWDAMSSQVDGMHGADDPGPVRPVTQESDRPSGRHRGHRFPARTNRVKVMYADDELAVVREAAHEVGLRLSGYVPAAALAAAEGNAPPGGRGKDRLLLAELIQLRIGLRQRRELAARRRTAIDRSRHQDPWVTPPSPGLRPDSVRLAGPPPSHVRRGPSR